MSAEVFSAELLAALRELPLERQRDMENSVRGFLGMDFLPRPAQRPVLRLVAANGSKPQPGAAP